MWLPLKKKSKSGRTPGIDGIPTEPYKTDRDVAVEELTRLFNGMWHEEKVPNECKKGLIVKIPKRAQKLPDVTSLPVDSKVMERVIIEIIQNGVYHDSWKRTRAR